MRKVCLFLFFMVLAVSFVSATVKESLDIEYYNLYDLDATIAKFGTVDKICYYVGETGQTEPYVWVDVSGVSVFSAAAQFSSFNQDLLEANSTGTYPGHDYFTRGYKAYDLEYENSNLIFAEFDVFFNGETGKISSVQIRKTTNPEEIRSGKGVTTYIMNPSILEVNHFDSVTGKYFDVNLSDGSIYCCEYEGEYDLDATIARLGTIDKLCYYTGKTGQIKPYIQTNKFGEVWVAVAAQFSSFKQNLLEAKSTGTYPGHDFFTHGYKAYDLDYENEDMTFAELAIFLNPKTGEMEGVQVRRITNPEARESGDYATTYFMQPSFVVNEE